MRKQLNITYLGLGFSSPGHTDTIFSLPPNSFCFSSHCHTGVMLSSPGHIGAIFFRPPKFWGFSSPGHIGAIFFTLLKPFGFLSSGRIDAIFLVDLQIYQEEFFTMSGVLFLLRVLLYEASI